VVYEEWLPLFLPRKLRNGLPNYFQNPGYSLYFGSESTGYNPSLNPQVPHVFQSAAMRFGHTSVTPGIWRRYATGVTSDPASPPRCTFGSTFTVPRTYTDANGTKSATFTNETSFQDLYNFFSNATDPVNKRIFNEFLMPSRGVNFDTTRFSSTVTSNTQGATSRQLLSAIRTCNSYFFPQPFVQESDSGRLFEGMAAARAEREDFIVTPDLRGNVFGPLDFTRRDLMAINIQRGRDHGLPSYNDARIGYGLPAITSFEQINPYYGMSGDQGMVITENIERLREVYNNDISKCDIWACGLAESTPDLGPGELFSEVLYDQFMRMRHGDRLWYENYQQNHLFTRGELELIRNRTMRDWIVDVMDVDSRYIQQDPFRWTNDAQYCPQPFQLSELYMDECTNLAFFDYYTESDFQIPIVWSLVFIYIYLCVAVLIVVAELGKRKRAKLLASKRPARQANIPGVEVADGSGQALVAIELRSGQKGEKMPVSMKFGEPPKKQIIIYSSGRVLRQIDLRYQTQIVIRRAFDNDLLFLVHIPKEYDVILQAQSAVERALFIEKIQGYLKDNGIECLIEEPQKKILLQEAFTKKDRQKLLESFFKAVFSEDAHEQYEASSVVSRHKDVLSCELTREEFADAMSMKKDSVFVDQMFELIDTDGNGFVSFREFLDMIVIFSKGSPDEKLRLMFNMYDVDRSGSLEKSEFKAMLKGMMELVNASVSPDQMDQLIESMFAAAGFQNKTTLEFADFEVLMRDHKEELSDAKLKISGYDVPESKVTSEKAELEPAEELPSRYKSRETAPARARRTIIKAYQDPKGQGQQAGSTSTVDIPTQKRQIGGVFKYFAAFLRYMENYKLHIFYLSIFFLVTIGIFVERAYYYSVEREHVGLRRIAGYGVTITRGAASCMMFTYAVLLLTMARNFITFLRETPFNNYVPFDAYLSFHKVIALTGLFFTVMHCLGHGINFYHIATQTANDLTCIFREVFHRSHQLPKFSYWLFLTMTGFSSFILTLVTIVIFVFAISYARRYWFQAFWFTHHWYYVFYFLMILHGSGRLVQDPLFGNFFLGPVIVFTLDQIISLSRNKVEVSIVRAELLPSEVVGLYFKRPITFDYKAGQWVRISCLALNPGEYHPFTISSAPHEENLSLHIRVVGPWTYNLREAVDPAVLRGQPYPKLFLDGPFGEGHQDWNRYDVAILVGGGIGVTPFASILKELVHRFNIGARIQCQRVYFIWVTRSQKKFEWFTDTIREAENADKKGLLESHIFITQFFEKFDLRTTMLVSGVCCTLSLGCLG
jgi:dual oxidase